MAYFGHGARTRVILGWHVCPRIRWRKVPPHAPRFAGRGTLVRLNRRQSVSFQRRESSRQHVDELKAAPGMSSCSFPPAFWLCLGLSRLLKCVILRRLYLGVVNIHCVTIPLFLHARKGRTRILMNDIHRWS